MQMHSRQPDNTFQPVHLRGEHTTAECAQAVIAPPWICVSGTTTDLLDEFLFDEFLEIIVQSSGTELIRPVGLTYDLLHDAVPVEILSCERQQDVQRRWR
jgi:hypothetical protein